MGQWRTEPNEGFEPVRWEKMERKDAKWDVTQKLWRRLMKAAITVVCSSRMSGYTYTLFPFPIAPLAQNIPHGAIIYRGPLLHRAPK